MKSLVAVGLCGAAVWAGVWAGETSAPSVTPQATVNYSLGYQLGRDLATLKGLGTTPDLAAIIKGMSDALAGAEASVSAQAMSQALADLRQQSTGQTTEGKDRGFEARKTSAFNSLHAGQAGLVTLPSGLQYKVIAAGSGRQPADGDMLTLNYQATLPNGVRVDNTYEDGEPARLRLNEVSVPGLQEALALMRPGAKWEVFVPPALGFSEYSTLRDRAMIYEIELLEVTPLTDEPTSAANPH